MRKKSKKTEQKLVSEFMSLIKRLRQVNAEIANMKKEKNL